MPEIFRTRDVVVFVIGPRMTLATTAAFSLAGWAGGIGVKWADSSEEFLVELSDGERGAGFTLWGSDEASDVLTSLTRSQPIYRYCVVGFGSFLMAVRVYEQFTYASRIAGPLVPISYAPKDPLYWSLRGRFTSEDEWALSGDPRAPNPYVVGSVVQAPSSLTNNFMTVQTLL
jgi:hypothetical protein